MPTWLLLTVSYSERDRRFTYFQKSQGFCFPDSRVLEEATERCLPGGETAEGRLRDHHGWELGTESELIHCSPWPF